MKAWKPKRRAGELVSERFGDDVIIVDPKTNQVFTLEGVVATVYDGCDGTRTSDDLASSIEAGDGRDVVHIVMLALEEISRHGLLTEPLPVEKARTFSRRDLLRRGAVAAAVSIPLIQTLVLPPPSFAATCLPSGSGCGTGAQCCSGTCAGGFCL